jgi:hypothetical protein
VNRGARSSAISWSVSAPAHYFEVFAEGEHEEQARSA